MDGEFGWNRMLYGSLPVEMTGSGLNHTVTEFILMDPVVLYARKY